MTEQAELTTGPRGHYGDHQPRTVTATPTWDSSLEAMGRWVVLESPAGWRAGVLFTDDHDRLGYVPLGADVNPGAPALAHAVGQALRSAKVAGAPSAQVFDWWAGQDSQTVSAGTVREGPLEQVAELFR